MQYEHGRIDIYKRDVVSIEEVVLFREKVVCRQIGDAACCWQASSSVQYEHDRIYISQRDVLSIEEGVLFREKVACRQRS